MSFEDIITVLPENYKQQGFNINPFINRAQNLAGNHPVIINTIHSLNVLGIELHSFTRNHLMHLYEEENLPFYVKIVVTFWWGGLNHAYQAPRFYSQDNLDRIQNFSEDLNLRLKELKEEEDTENFVQLFGKFYNDFKLNEGPFNMAGINTSFFTKIFQFFFCVNPPASNSQFTPIIADKWSKIAVLCDMIDQGFNWQEVFNIPGKIQNGPGFVGNNAQEYESYWSFVVHFNDRVHQLGQQEIFISACQLEGLLFGWGRDNQNPQNPRFHYQQCLIAHFGRQ
jgi:hypothetical protein